MKYRGAAAHTGLGGNAVTFMDCQETGDSVRDELVRQCSKDAYETFFKGTKLDYDGVDAQSREYEVRVGIEPSYQFDPLKIVCVSRTKENSYIMTGRAVGDWASRVIATKKYYSEYQRQTKFVRFIDKWHPILFLAPYH